MKTTAFSTFTGFRLTQLILFLVSLNCIINCRETSAQCVPPEVDWEHASIYLLRCGSRGLLTNDTYFRRERYAATRTIIAGGSASWEQRSTNTYSHSLFDCNSSPTCRIDSGSAEIINFPEIPCECPGAPGECDACASAYSSMIASYDFCSTTTNIFHRSNNLEVVEYEHYFRSAGMCGELTERFRTELYFDDPYTLTSFADDTLAAAMEQSWVAGGPLMILGFEDTEGKPDRICSFATIPRYYVKFQSKLGVTHSVDASILLTSNKRTNVYGTSFTRVGDGSVMRVGPFYLPRPLIEEVCNLKVLGVEVTDDDSGSCSSGSCGASDHNSTGNGPDYLASAAFMISLGAGSVDESAGALRMEAEAPSSVLTTPAALTFNLNTNVVTVVTNSTDGSIHIAAPTVLARIVTNSYAYWIYCSVKTNGVYLTNSPYLSHLLINPHGSTNTNTLRHVRFRDGSAVTNDFVCEAASDVTNIWTLVSGNGLKGERLAKITYTNTQTRLESYSIFDPGTSTNLFRRDRLYSNYLSSEFLLSETIDPGGLNLVTTNTYNGSGQLLLSIRPDGSWERREYDASGWLTRIVRPFTNQPPTASTNDCRVTEHSYVSVAGSSDISTNQPGKPRTVWELVRGEVVSKTMYSYPNEFTTRVQVAASPGDGWDHADNEKTSSIEDAEHRPTRMDHADGTRTAITYTDNGAGRLTITTNGAHSSGAFSDGTRLEEQVDTLGRMLWRTNYDIASTKVISGASYTDRDEFLRPTTINYLDGTTSVSVKQDCCNAAYTVDRDGVTNTFAYDALKRLVSTARLGITNFNVLDAADRVLLQKRKGTNGNEIVLRRMLYDAANRLVRETNALGAVTSHSYTVDGSSQQVNTTTNADGGIRVETYFRDGQLASVTGTAAFPVRYAYGWDSAGAYTAEIKLDGSGTDTLERTTNYTDAFGRTYKTVFPGSGGPYRQSFYNSKGQLWKERDPDGVVTLYTNNNRGELAYTCVDSNRNNLIDLSGQDRVTQTTNHVTTAHSTDVVRTRTYVWDVHGSSTPTLLSTVEQSVDGLRTWQTNATAVTTTVRTVPSGGAYTVTRTSPDSTYSISLYQSGRLVSVTQHDSTGAQLGKLTYGYDAHGRRNTMTDARNATTTYTFNDADQIVSVISPAPSPGAAPQVTTTFYDVMGRATNVVQPDGTSRTTEYFTNGLVKKKFGSRDYPVAYTYDPQGRLATMTTWTNFSASGGAAVTTWHYDALRGWLTNKVYADNQGTKYSYTDSGRLTNRWWARGTNTSYSYNSLGDLSEINYSGTGTPAVTQEYTRRGQLGKVIRDGITTTLFYNSAGQLLSEHYSGGTLNGLRVTNSFDSMLRRTQTAARNGATALNSTDYDYDDAGRLETVTDGTSSAAYSYVANSPLVGQITFKQSATTRMTTTKAHDKLNRLTSISSASSQLSTPIAFNYSYNDANQRTRSHLADGSYWSYEYDALGQVKSGKRYWSDGTPVAGQQFEYGFDDIGNRRTTKTGGDQVGAALRAASYTVNSLNQITQCEVPSYINIIGAATATATNVNVNDTNAYRRGEYYRVELNPNNTNAAVWQSVTSRAVQSGTTNSVTGNVFLPQTPEIFDYDADGNLTNDGHWAYTWDGENRLTRLIAHSSLATGARQTLLFSNDWQGRRISKVVSNWTGSGWTKSYEQKFLYDSWNLVAILDDSNALLQSFRWGTDLSGTQQGAGGVGGLISMTVHSGTYAGTYFYAYDGNANVAALINAADSSIAARYEYGPFGEVIRATGPLAFVNPFRFSTKFQDDETGFLYYGYRYYAPSTGRWLSRDPLDEDGGLNLFGFVHNDPQTFIDLYGLNWLNSIRNLPLPPDLIERIYAWLMARIVDNKYVKVTRIDDVRCPDGASRHLLYESDEYVEDRNEISLNVIDYDLISFRVYKPKKHLVRKVYGCCHDCWGFNTKGWNETKDERFKDVASEGFNFDVASGEIAVKEHSVTTIRSRECKQSVPPKRSWTEWEFPKLLK